jgi:hypothetical protein
MMLAGISEDSSVLSIDSESRRGQHDVLKPSKPSTGQNWLRCAACSRADIARWVIRNLPSFGRSDRPTPKTRSCNELDFNIHCSGGVCTLVCDL